MAQEILNNVLNSKILPEEIINWLLADNQQQNFDWTNGNQNLPRAEFVAYFLNFLRDQFAVAQPAATNIKPTPSKDKTAKPTATNLINKETQIIDNSGSLLNDVNKLNDTLDNSRSSEIRSTLNISTNNENPNQLTKGILIIKSPENRKQIFESNKSSDSLLGSEGKIKNSQANKQFKKRISLQSVNEKSADGENNLIVQKNVDSPQQQQKANSSQLLDQSFSNSRNSETNFNRLFSPGNDLLVNLSKEQCSSLNASLLSQNCSQYDCSSNSSQISENSFLNSSLMHYNNELKNPVSPLYSQSMMTTPKNTYKSQNRSMDKQTRTNNNNFKHSTPEQLTNSSQKNVKSTSRQNISLADFITIDTRSSKKSSGKKNNQKTQLSRHTKEDDSASSPMMSSSVLSEENFPEVGQSFERRRRIKPTKLDVSSNKGDKENAVFGTVNRPATTNPQFSEVQSTDQLPDNASFEMERVLLRIERQKKPETTNENKSGDQESQLKTRPPPRAQSSLSKSIIIPSLSLIDQTEILKILIQLYCAFIDNNLILNPMTEMYFIISLITTQYHRQQAQNKSSTNESGNITETCLNIEAQDLESDLGCALLSEELSKIDEDEILIMEKNEELVSKLQLDDKTESINSEILSTNTKESDEILKIDELHLGTPHNCVFFSTNVLNSERHWLKFLDRTTLKLLSENSHIAEFQPELQIYLQELYNAKLSKMNRTKQHTFSFVDPNVSFQIDTDNRENFPTAIAFQSFRKQRDMFYEILKIWEENHSNSNWKFSVALNQKIKMMLTLHSDVTNHCHIARLFKSQLLISCIHSGQQEDAIDEESLSILKSLKDINPEKLTQLKERLVTPLSSKGPVPEPTFQGVQEFYKNFILYSFNPMFYAHLEDCLIHEILELNDMQFTAIEIGDSETTVDERTKQNFIICLLSLRLLGKFLGFLVSLPYRSSTSSYDEVVKSQVSLRCRIVPVLNLQACLQEAIVRGKLTLTIPWIVEYLSQLDTASLRLPYYKQLLEILYCIYRISKLDVPFIFEQFISQQTLILIKFSLGWLFELPNFPTDFYFTWQSSHSEEKLLTLCKSEEEKMQISIVNNKNDITLDRLDIIDERVLYSCCPFLMEFKILLTGNSQSTGNKTNRHITPVSSQLPNAADSTNAKNLELQLEEAFFNGQPASTRKTIEFVSERVASTCVKYIFNNLLTTAQENCLNKLRQKMIEKHRKMLENTPNGLKTLMLKEMNNLGASITKEVKEKIEKEIPAMCKTRISQSIDSLLAVDTLLTVKETCIQITIRMAQDRIAQWIQSHIGDLLFMRDMEFKISQVAKNEIDNANLVENEDKHNLSAACPTDVLDDLRACSWEFLDNNGKSVTIEFVSKILDQLYSSSTERADLIPGPENYLRTMSVDLFLFIVTYRREILTTEIEMKFVKYWKLVLTKTSEANFSLSRILSPRNVIILEKSKSNAVWTKCGNFVKLLLKEKILSLECLSDQCVALLRQEWPTETLQNLSKCLIIGIEDYKASDESAERIRYLIRWIAETYKDIDNLDN